MNVETQIRCTLLLTNSGACPKWQLARHFQHKKTAVFYYLNNNRPYMHLGCDEKIFPLDKSSFKCLGKCITNFSLVLVVSCKSRKRAQLENHRHNTLQIHHCQLRAITIERKQDILYSLILANLLLIAKFKP
jgi:hypothetical protein